jgi:hypothetical protein
MSATLRCTCKIPQLIPGRGHEPTCGWFDSECRCNPDNWHESHGPTCPLKVDPLSSDSNGECRCLQPERIPKEGHAAGRPLYSEVTQKPCPCLNGTFIPAAGHVDGCRKGDPEPSKPERAAFGPKPQRPTIELPPYELSIAAGVAVSRLQMRLATARANLRNE